MSNDSMLDKIADAFIVSASETFNDDSTSGEELRAWSTLQEIIDNVNDHNELMLEAIRTISEDVSELIETLMNEFELNFRDGEETLAWVHVINCCFRAVKRRLGEI